MFFFNQTLSLFANGIKICVDVGSLGSENMLILPKVTVVIDDDEDSSPVPLLCHDDIDRIDDMNNAQSEYRCQKCNGCIVCKKRM